MSLFKRLLLSLFPEHFGGSVGPASMFLGLVNAKHFFTVITKRMVENPKLNLFDIGMDPVEVKIWFGNEAHIKPKDLELYFSYCVCANLNGYKFYNPTNIGALLSISLSQYFVGDFPKNKRWTDQFMVLLICINIVSYVFAARIKIFPLKMSKKDSFNWFITVFFSYYTFLLGMYQVKIGKKSMADLQSKLIAHTDIFFWLYYVYQSLNNCLENDQAALEEYFDRLFSDELKKNKIKTDFLAFQANAHEYVYSTELSPMEDKLLDALMPAEILMKLFYNREDVFWMSEYVVPHIYDNQKMDMYLRGFLGSDAHVEEWVSYLMDHKPWKLHFFGSLKKMLIHKFKKNGPDHEDMEDLLSSISDGMGMVELPESLRKEGVLMDRILNFYVGLMWLLWIGRGDTMFLRMFRPKVVTAILENTHSSEKPTINFYWDLLFQYSKNAFFYKTIFDGVRSWKASFMLPYVADIKEVYNNEIVLRHFDENAICILLQDLLTKDLKLSIHQTWVVDIFQQLHGEEIWRLIKLDHGTLLQQAYGGLESLLSKPVMVNKLIEYCKKSDIKNLRENLYTFEYWLMKDIISSLKSLDLWLTYSDSIIINVVAILKDTLVGMLFLLHMALQKQLEKKIDLKVYNLLNIYWWDILHLTPELADDLGTIIYRLYSKYEKLIELRIKIDDNQYFLEVGADCWWIFVNKELNTDYQITAEDILWLRGYLKHITYYNKRFITPKL